MIYSVMPFANIDVLQKTSKAKRVSIVVVALTWIMKTIKR